MSTPEPIVETLRWISVSERLPAMGQPVVYRLSGAPKSPKVGFRDCPRAYDDRHPDRKAFEWKMVTWWAEFDDDDDTWEDQYVIDWHPLAEFPP